MLMLLPWVLPVDDLVVTVLDASDVATMVVVDVAAVTAVDVVVFAVVNAVDVAAVVVVVVAALAVVAVPLLLLYFLPFSEPLKWKLKFPSQAAKNFRKWVWVASLKFCFHRKLQSANFTLPLKWPKFA